MDTLKSAGIYHVLETGELVTLRERQYDSEDLLQKLLAQYPSILAGDQINPEAPRQWLLVKREAAVPGCEDGHGRWALDHLFLDQDGVPTLVEVKRSTDTRIRREVVGQLLDYAANAMAYWSLESIQSNFEQTCSAEGKAPEIALADFLGPGAGATEFWQRVKTNLQAGKLRLLFVADEIPRELRRIVEFLNAQMDPAEVLAVEIKLYAGGSLKTLVPRLIGQTAEAEERKSTASRSARHWDEASFFAELARRVEPADVDTARALYDWATRNADRISFGRGAQHGSIFPIIDHEHWHAPFAMWTYGVVELQFQHEAGKPPFNAPEKRAEMLGRLNGISGISLPVESLQKRPGIRLAALRSPEALPGFLDVMDWFVRVVRAGPAPS